MKKKKKRTKVKPELPVKYYVNIKFTDEEVKRINKRLAELNSIEYAKIDIMV